MAFDLLWNREIWLYVYRVFAVFMVGSAISAEHLSAKSIAQWPTTSPLIFFVANDTGWWPAASWPTCLPKWLSLTVEWLWWLPNYLMIAEVHMPCKDSFSKHCAKSKKVYPYGCGPYSFFVYGWFFVGFGLCCAPPPLPLLHLLRSFLVGFQYFKIFNTIGGLIPFAYAPFFLSLPICLYNIILSLISKLVTFISREVGSGWS